MASDDFTLDRLALKTYFKCSDRECNILFDHFDMDGNGKIDSYEFICAMTMLSHSTLEVIKFAQQCIQQEKAELIFGLYDFDGSKYISRDELVILLTNSLSSLKSMQKLPPPQIQEIEKKADEFFLKADTDSDKKITLQEFKKYITKDKEILEVLVQSQVARKEDLGMDFGSGKSVAPECDPDLESECCPKDLKKTDKKQNIKDGIDMKLKQNENGEFFEEQDIGEGDQFMAVKPWLGVVANSKPTKFKPSQRDGEAPDATLQLEHIYGYRCHDARNNLRYNRQGNIVYHAAGVGIVHNFKTNTQRFFMEHNDDIHCLAVDPTGVFAATGQIGPKPWLCVWNTETMECVSRMQGVLLKGIKCVAFSPNGQYLAASAFDDDHTIAIYDWAAKPKTGEALKPIASGKGTRANILSLGFNTTGDQLVATCVKEVNFYTFNGGLLQCKKGTGWGVKAPQEGILCQAFVDNILFTGSFGGSIIQWNGTTISKAVKAHTEGGCQAMYSRTKEKGIITGGGDGLVIVWSYAAGNLTQQLTFDLKTPDIKSMMPKARSVCEHPVDGTLLIGTRGGEILSYKPGDAKPLSLMRSHFEGELWGLATHPNKEEFVTIGQDNMFAIWDIKTRKQKQFGKLDCGGNVIAYTHDGSKLAIGYNNGTVQVLSLDQAFSVQAVRKDRKEAISEIKFSPDDSICAVGAHDSCIFTYDAKNGFKPMKKMRGHPSTVTHFDFSLDGNYIMSNCTSYNILFFDVRTGKHNPSGASSLRDETWETWTCSLGWPVQGIFPPCADGSDINAVDRSPEGTVLATADDFGMVKLFKYPCPVDRASFNQYIGHSSHVTNVRFVKRSPYLISTGGEDKCIFQWKYFFDKESHLESEKTSKAVVDVSNIQNDFSNSDDDFFQEQEMGEGDQKLAVEPFKGEVINSVPWNFKITPTAGDKPNGNLKLKYAHGFRSFDTRGNLKYKSQNEIVFTTAALGIVLDKTTNTQRFFNLHEEDVVSMAMHPNKDIIATGQMAAKGKAKMIDIFIWKASTLECLGQLNKFHLRAVRNLQFSPSGEKLVSVGEDDFHSVAIWDWANKKMLSSAKVDPDKVFDVCWKDETEFATVGMKHVKFFTLAGSNLTPNKGLYGTGGATATICCNYVFDTKTFLAGTPQGNLLIFNGRTVSKSLKGHTDALWAIQAIKNNTVLITGGNDAKIVFWDKTFVQTKTIDLTPMSNFQAGVRSMDYHEQANTLIVGTRGAEIIEVNANTGAKIKTLINGHFEGTKQAELWGCAVHPKQQLFASCGADKTIRIWKFNEMFKCSQQFENDLTACDWSSTGDFIVVGDRAGFIHSIDANTLQLYSTAKSTLANAVDQKAWVEDVKISPNSQMVAFGTHGGLSRIELVKVTENGKKLTKIASVNVAISSALTHLDWSMDSNSLVINSQAYELMWLDVNSQTRITASSSKDIEWHTWTCLFGFPVQGIWPGVDYTDVNSVCRSFSRNILATADDFGKVKLFKYPCVVDKAQHNTYMGHSSHVTKVKFSYNDKYVITTGGNDKTVIVWETDFSLDDPNAQINAQEEEKYAAVDYGDDDFYETKIDKSKEAKIQAKRLEMDQSRQKTKAVLEDDFFDAQDVGIGDEFAAVKPWIGQIREPTGYTKPRVNQKLPPTVKFDIEWVHGYRSRDSRNNIGLLIDGSIAYHAAALGVVYNPTEHSQRFFNMHIDDVTAIAFSPDKRTIATGEIGPKPMICIWDAITMQLKHQLKGKLTKGIQCLAFSPSGKTLAGVGIDEDHSVAVYNVETGALLGTEKGDKAWIIDIAFKDDSIFATSGVKHFKEWNVGATLISKKGQFGKYDMRHGVCKYMGDQCLSASITGELYVWTGVTISKAVKLHEKPMDCIHISGQQYVLTGGKDCVVNILQYGTLAQIYRFTIDELAWGSVCGKVRALYLADKKLYVGTLGSEIYQVQLDIATKQLQAPTLLVNGHYSPSQKDNNEVWGMSVVPNKGQYVTVSDDATLRVWDIISRKQFKCVPLNLDQNGQVMPLDPVTQELSNSTKARCCDCSNDGKFCAVGFKDGTYRIYETTNWKMVAKKKASEKLIQDLKFSPNSKMLAVSAHDFKIYIYSLPKLERLSICKASTAGVTHIDWSLDSQVIHSNDLSYEVLYYRTDSGEQDKSGASNYRDEFWATWTLPLGWPVQGIWPPLEDGSDINAVDRSNVPHQDGYHLLASANDSSLVKLFRYPSVDERSEFIEGRGHSSHVTNVKFSKDDQHLFSAGGNDTCIIQWKITS